MCLQKEIPTGRFARISRRLRTEVRGAELFEFAIILPVLLMVLIGMFWIGYAVSVYQTLGRAAREGARVALSSTCASCGDSASSDTDVDTAVNDALSAASLDPTNPNLQIQITRNQILDPNDPARYQVSGVTVTVTYPMKLAIPFTPQNGTTINISSTVSMRQEF